jgi:hypothetical protein
MPDRKFHEKRAQDTYGDPWVRVHAWLDGLMSTTVGTGTISEVFRRLDATGEKPQKQSHASTSRMMRGAYGRKRR